MGCGMWHDVVKPIEVAKCEACGFSAWFSGGVGWFRFFLADCAFLCLMIF